MEGIFLGKKTHERAYFYIVTPYCNDLVLFSYTLDYMQH